MKFDLLRDTRIALDGSGVKKITALLGRSTIVKPVAEGSSIGMSVCRSADELKEGIKKAFRHYSEVMIEEYVDGREITCCVMGNKHLTTFYLNYSSYNPLY